MRLFVAVDLPLPLLRQVTAGIAELRENVGRGRQFRWVAADNIHVTLKFLGEVGENQLNRFSACCAAIEWSPFRLELGGSGYFPSLKRPRVFWQGFSAGIDEMRGLPARVELCAAGIDVPKDQRLYTPHLTLARIKTRKNYERSDIFPALQKQADGLLPLGSSFTVKSFSLYHSQLTPAGAMYHRLKTFSARMTGAAD